MSDVTHSAVSFERRKRREATEFRLVLFLTFSIFLVQVIATRLMPWNWRTGSGSQTRRPILSEAWQKANACIGISFMSW